QGQTQKVLISIPGLSQSAEAGGPAERISCRRVGIFDTDSDYTKLAKGGGHKGHLKRSPSTPSFFSHRTSRWFCDFSGSKATSPDGRAKARMQPLTAPFGTDNNAPWERETDRFSPDKQKVNGPESPVSSSIHLI
uniref:Uncharacterized protein n=1 Tax=Mola mola TaxID=94237 RepID=A0A3Q3XC78_MOLML